MKTTLLSISGICCLAVSTALAQPQSESTRPAGVAESTYTVKERGPHHRVWERIEYEPTYDGKVVERRRSYQELATGLHFKNEQGEWEESEEKIEILPNDAGAMASKGQHKAIFPPELQSGLIELQTPDGQWLRSRVWGLAYFDASTGESVLLAEVKESEGQVIGQNVVLYPNAFTDFRADVRYVYTRAKFEQDVILREQPPAPEDFGLNPETTRLQVLTEFVEAPQPGKARKRAGNLEDELLQFGAMTIGAGKAFSTGDAKNLSKHVPVGKNWGQIEGRTFLTEEALYKKVSGELQKLPPARKYEGASLQRRGKGESALAGLKELLPKRYAKATPVPSTRPRLMARVAPKNESGFVMDYVTLNATYTNYVFKGDTTYYISGATVLKSNTVVEGGTVIKFNTTGAEYLELLDGTIECQTAPYRPAVFTSKNDNTVGETISGSTGTPTVIDTVYIFSDGAAPELDLKHVRMSYVSYGLYVMGMDLRLTDSQFRYSTYPVYCDGAAAAVIRNVLIHDVAGAALTVYATSLDVQHLTVNKSGSLFEGFVTTPTFTNCLFVSVTNWGESFTSVNNATNASSSTVFQTVGGGGHYLATNSPYRNVGTTNINADLLTRLRSTTTYPPIAYTNITFTAPMTFNPQAQRDTDTPDLGYHYDPLDYTFGGCHANSNITFTAGTAVGWFRTSSGWNHAGFGIHLGDKQVGSFEGTVASPCYWVRLPTVQENDRTAGYGPGGMEGWATTAANAPDARARFTRFSLLAGDGNHFRDDYGWLNLRAQNCEFLGGGIGGYIISMYFTNCLFQRSYVAQVDGNGPCHVVMRNCTMIGGLLQFVPSSSYAPTFKIFDSAFDGNTFQFSGPAANATYAQYDYNAYTNTTRPFPSGIGGANDVAVSGSFNWQSSWLGNYYQPSDSPLIDEGSVTADAVGLFHFTSQASQTKESNSQVDIGYHYVAVDGNGVPLDSDSDGVPDYREDVNGNGTVQSGETDWESATDYGLRVIITEPKRATNLP